MTVPLRYSRIPAVARFGACLLLCAFPASMLAAADVSEIDPARAQLDAQFAANLDALADKCDELGLERQAKITRDWIIPRDPSRHYIFLPAASDPHQPPAGAEMIVEQWHAKFTEHRQAQAAGLFDLARRSLEAGDAGRAYRLLHEVLREDPRHEESLRIVRGDEKRRRSASSRPRVQTSSVRHPKFGWAPRRYWVVETEHYRVSTNAGVREGVDLAQRLEELCAVWKQLFFRYWTSGELLAQRFAGGSAPLGQDKQHRVVLFRDRDEYAAQLRAVQRIEITLGIYLDADRTACFFAGDSGAETTWLHEAGHQLFYELGDAVEGVGARGNMWVVEGAALYLESLQEQDGYYTAGGLDARRLQFARYWALNNRRYTPLAELVGLDRESLQQHQQIQQLYSQSAGLAHFFMHSDGGKLRPALIEYVRRTHQDRDDPSTLAALAGIDYAELDKQYHLFLHVTDDDLARLAEPNSTQQLVLGHTSITDAGLAHLAGNTELVWLDLAYTKTGDAGLAHLADAKKLKQLNLEHTGISDAALDLAAGFRELQELDLSGTAVSDAGLAKLAPLRNLKILWLTDTQISDAGLAHLRALRNLETLETSGTRITPAGMERLQRSLPKLGR